MIGVLLVIDAAILIVWLIIDPMERQEKRLPRVSIPIGKLIHIASAIDFLAQQFT